MHRRGEAWRAALLAGLGRATLFLLVGVAMAFSSLPGAEAANGCTPVVAQIVSIQGVVELRRARDASWKLAEPGAVLCPGDLVRVGRSSRAAVRLANESTLRLDQRTTVTLEGLDAQKSTLLELLTGVFHLITRTPKPFKIKTPFVTAGVEGTEFTVSVDEQGARLAVFEGRVSAANEHGSLMLVSGEAAVAAKGQAPRKELAIRPADAVQWALYYPTIVDYRLGAGTAGTPGEAALRDSIAFYRQGRLAEAINRLDNVPESLGSPRFLTYRAGLLLLVGRVDEAGPDVQRALELDPRHSDAYALQSVVAVVRNDKDQALNLAGKAVEFNETSPSARIALSYAQQAHFRIEEALASVQKAVELDPQNALAWARLAELHMSTGYLDRALDAAQRAVSLNPDLAKTQSVLGFANLTRIDTKAAKQAFSKAIELDQADPLPRLGLGLAKIREGDLTAGREEIEIATSLDPENSLLRSYVGKAYYEEKRDKLAGTQFDLAKERDPKDPTPWFYDAIRKQTENRPVEALQDLNKSIELNDNRAVYRSQLLLDQDLAAREASLARIYDDLGFGRLAVIEAAKSLTEDPTNYSAHRFLSDAYARLDRQEIGRVSELLQAQLLQPININPVRPQFAFADFNVAPSLGTVGAAFNEYTRLFERDRPLLTLTGIGGNHGTWGDEAILAGVNGRFSYSLGQFHYDTDGFRPNNDLRQDIYDLYSQFAVSPNVNFQAEYRKRNIERGDLRMNFDPGSFSASNRASLDQESYRLGARFSPSPHSTFLVSLIHNTRDTRQSLFDVDAPTVNEQIVARGDQSELQYLFSGPNLSVIAGFGDSRIERHGRTLFDFTPLLGVPCPFPSCDVTSDFTVKQQNGHLYLNKNLAGKLLVTIGVSHDYSREGSAASARAWNPKFGLTWLATDAVRIRAAAFKAFKRRLIVDQTIEPTNLAGFNQFFDDFNETRTKVRAMGLDGRLSSSLRATVEFSRRDLDVPGDNPLTGEPLIEKRRENKVEAGFFWTARPSVTATVIPSLETFKSNGLGQDPTDLRTFTLPLAVRYFSATGLLTGLVTTYVRQKVERLVSSPLASGKDSFVVVDGSVGYRLPRRTGMIALEVRNIFNRKFFFQDDNFRTTFVGNNLPRYIPARSVILKASLAF